MTGVLAPAMPAEVRAWMDRPLPGGPAWLRAAREAALARFGAMGFPSTRLEEWKFTNVAAVARTAFEPAESGPGPDAGALRALLGYGDWSRTEVVFVDGRLAPHLSSPGVVGLAESLDDPHVESAMSIDPAETRDGFAALNLALFTDGATLQVRGVVERPIHLVFVSTGREAPTDTHVRNVITLDRGAQATVVETWLGAGRNLVNGVTDLAIGEGAVLTHVRVQRGGDGDVHVGRVLAALGRSSTLRTHAVSMGGALARHDVAVTFGAEGGDCALDGLYVTAGAQHVDHHTTVDHAAPRCGSNQLYKGVIDGESRAVFNGKVVVRPGATKSDAHQTNRNLVVSKRALVHTKPQLEIFNDDVKCSHGATVGQLEALPLFYLRSRGIDEAAARRMLTHAFAVEVVDRLPVAAVRDWVGRHLAGGEEG